MELRDYLQLLRRRWLLLVLTVEAAMLAGLVATALTASTYQSSARLFVTNPVATPPRAPDYYSDSRFSQERVASYAALMSGTRVADSVRRRLGLPLSTDELRKKVSAEPVPQTVLFVVSVTDTDAARARQLTQAFTEEFLKLVPELESEPLRLPDQQRVLVVDPPSSAVQVAPRLERNLALAFAFGLLTGAGMVVLRETTDRTVRSPEQLATVTGQPCLGVVELPQVVSSGQVPSPEVDVRWLAAKLPTGGEGARRSLLLTAADHDPDRVPELALPLALALGQSEIDVVLVDATGPDSALAAALDLAATPGLAEVLGAGVVLQDVLQPLDRHVRVLGPGLVHARLNARAVTRVLDELAPAVDLVLVVAPPLLADPDAGVWASAAGGTLLLVGRGETTTDDVQRCVQLVAQLQGTLAGGALTTVGERPRRRTERRARPRPDGGTPGPTRGVRAAAPAPRHPLAFEATEPQRESP